VLRVLRVHPGLPGPRRLRAHLGLRRPLVHPAPRVLPGLRVPRLLTNCYKNCAII
jgi:hypothetical protein